MFSSKALLLALFCSQAWASVTLVQAVGPFTSTSGDRTVTFSSQPIVGDYVVAACAIGTPFTSRPLTNITDNQGNTYTKISNTNSGTAIMLAYAKVAISSGSFDVTCAANAGACCTVVLLAIEYSGIASSSPADGSSQSGGTSSSLTPGGFATSNTDDLIIGFCGGAADPSNDIFFTAAAGYTMQTQRSTMSSSIPVAAYEDQSVSSAGTYTASMTASQSLAYRCAAFGLKIQSSSVGVQSRALLGVGR